jgi:hypothetical protein
MEEEKFHTTTSTWSDSIENTIKDIGDSCLAYKWMNILSVKKNELKYNILMYTSIIIGPVSGILSAVSNGDNLPTLDILVTVFSFLSGVISAVIKFSEFGEKAISYKTAAAKYSSLENNIKRQLSLHRDDRVNAGEYLEWISTSYDELFSGSPLVTDEIYEEWIRFAKENNIETKIKQHAPLSTVKTETNVDLTKYSDGKMRYEMARLFRMK